MNKPTINGIDVSEWELKGVLIPITECKYFEGIGDCKETKGLCVSNENCDYKQRKRLQEENKELKEKIDIYESSIIANHDGAVGKRLMEVLLALEEIRKAIGEKYGMADIIKIRTILDEVLNDRD